MRSALIQLVTAISLCSGAGLKAQELIGQERWPDGTLRATRYRDGGRIHFITYHENGRVRQVGCFNHGRRDGTWKEFSDSGVLLAHAGFADGRRQGVWQFRSADDSPVGTLVYASGMLVRGEEYGPDGDLIAQRDYRP